MKRLQNLTWKPSWTSVLGCIEGCLEYLNISASPGWLYGGTGHAFLINMSQDGSCPSGPTGWETDQFFKLGENIGYKIDAVYGDSSKEEDWEKIQKRAWDFTRTALDEGKPVVAWELEYPEFYIVDGYDGIGYYYNGPGAEPGTGPKAWNELGNTPIGILEILSLQPIQPADHQTTIREGLSFAVSFNQGPSKWILANYLTGLDAYQVWIDAVSSGKAMSLGHAYNAAVWEECRTLGVAFLQEAKQKLNGRLSQEFTKAIKHYSMVSDQLKKVTELYPFAAYNNEEPIGKNQRSEQAAEHLQAAQSAEAEGMKYLKRILKGVNELD
jgi:hypothetical protein